MTDKIADALTRIRNGYMRRKNFVEIPYSKGIERILHVLLDEGYLALVQKESREKSVDVLVVTLKYHEGMPAIREMERVSRPGCRVYVSKQDIPLVHNGLGVVILSTPQGVMTGAKAAHLGQGGEVFCKVF